MYSTALLFWTCFAFLVGSQVRTSNGVVDSRQVTCCTNSRHGRWIRTAASNVSLLHLFEFRINFILFRLHSASAFPRTHLVRLITWVYVTTESREHLSFPWPDLSRSQKKKFSLANIGPIFRKPANLNMLLA